MLVPFQTLNEDFLDLQSRRLAGVSPAFISHLTSGWTVGVFVSGDSPVVITVDVAVVVAATSRGSPPIGVHQVAWACCCDHVEPMIVSWRPGRRRGALLNNLKGRLGGGDMAYAAVDAAGLLSLLQPPPCEFGLLCRLGAARDKCRQSQWEECASRSRGGGRFCGESAAQCCFVHGAAFEAAAAWQPLGCASYAAHSTA